MPGGLRATSSADGAVAVVPDARTLDGCLDALERLARDVAALPLDALDAAAAARAADRLLAVSDQARAVRTRLLARVESDGRWAASGGSRTFPEWVARRTGGSVGTARRDAVVGRALAGDLPLAREAVAKGRISFEHAQVLATLAPTSAGRRAALASDRDDRNEAFLVRAAEQLGVDDFRRLVRRWGAAHDAAALEREHADAVAREYLAVGRRPDGVQLTGFLAAENAETLLVALRAVEGVPAADDDRAPEQRRAAALTGLARLVLDKGLGGAGGALVRPHLSVHVSLDALRAMADDAGVRGDLDGALAAAELDDGTPIPASVLARLACDGEISRIVFGPDSAPLDVGRAQRVFTGQQRRGVVARDRCCRYPGCGAPASLGEVHHVRWWTRDDGPTSVPNGVLLCWYHHGVVHRRDISIAWRAEGGGWDFRERDGRVIVARAGPGGSPPGSSPPGSSPQGELPLAG